MPVCQEQLNLIKSETGESEIIAFESEETVVEKITVESKDIQMPACQEQFNLTKSETGESEIIAFERH